MVKKISINRNDEIALDEILYLQSDVNYTAIHTINRERLVVSRTLGVMENRINEQSFIRISNSHLVNLSFIISCRKDDRRLIVRLNDGQEFHVSRRRVGVIRELIRKSPKATLLRNK